MKPETQYRLLVKCASADRAARILALGAAGLAKRAAKKEVPGDSPANAAWRNRGPLAGAKDYITNTDNLKDLAAGAGAAGIGGLAAYGLTGLVPGLKKQRLARILAAITGAGAAGVGGYKGMGALRGLKADAGNWRDLVRFGNDNEIGLDPELGPYVYDREKGARVYDTSSPAYKAMSALNVGNKKQQVIDDIYNSQPHNNG